jgi:uncharacterized repeat protein (TIGR03837 family)
LAKRNHSVRLWLKGDPSALSWMAPEGHEGVQLLTWDDAPHQIALKAKPPDVLIEAFGCEPPAPWLQHCVNLAHTFPLWLNLEYLSAEAYVARCHGLASPVMSGPAKGQKKWFFYPGFTAQTGGLMHRLPQATPKTSASSPAPSTQITLFCYEPVGLPDWLHFLQQGGMGAGVTLHIAPGRATQAVRDIQAHTEMASSDKLHLDFLPPCPQVDFDERLSHSDLNFVRGEDSLVSAIFANRPFIWQIYPQDDGAHEDKLLAFLDWLQAPPSLRLAHLWWNGLSASPPTLADLSSWFAPAEQQNWAQAVTQAREKCLHQADLVDQILAFCTAQSDKNTLKS